MPGVSYGLAMQDCQGCCCTSHLYPYRAILLLFLVLLCHQQWLFSKCFDVICSHCPRHRHRQTSLLTHMILCKIRVRHRYFIKQVRPGWPATWLIRITRPGYNPDYNTWMVKQDKKFISMAMLDHQPFKWGTCVYISLVSVFIYMDKYGISFLCLQVVNFESSIVTPSSWIIL